MGGFTKYPSASSDKKKSLPLSCSAQWRDHSRQFRWPEQKKGPRQSSVPPNIFGINKPSQNLVCFYQYPKYRPHSRETSQNTSNFHNIHKHRNLYHSLNYRYAFSTDNTIFTNPTMTDREKLFEWAIYLQPLKCFSFLFFFLFFVAGLFLFFLFFQHVAVLPLFFFTFFSPDFSSCVSLVFEVLHSVSDSLFGRFLDRLFRLETMPCWHAWP